MNWRVLMSYTVNEKRKQTMIERLGDAIELIDNQAFLPFYRSIQIKLEKAGKAVRNMLQIQIYNHKDL